MTKKEKTILANRLESEVFCYYVALGRSVAYYNLEITKAKARENHIRAGGRLHSTEVIINALLGTNNIREAAKILGLDIQSIKESASKEAITVKSAY